MRLLGEQVPEAFSSYIYPDCVIDLEKSKQILKEMKKFDLISYLIYYKNELSDEERKPKTIIETMHNRYKHKFTSRHQFKEFKKMEIELDVESKIDTDTVILFSKDPEGNIPIKTIGNIDMEKKEKTFTINSKSFYIHYPYSPHQVK